MSHYSANTEYLTKIFIKPKKFSTALDDTLKDVISFLESFKEKASYFFTDIEEVSEFSQ